MKCPNCEFHCTLTKSWSGKCGMYRINNGEGNLKKIENKFYTDYLISEFSSTWIESVPMFHYKPGVTVLNIGTISCNFDCKYCLNERLARVAPEHSDIINLFNEPPERLIKRANLSGISAIVFGQNEPTVSMDYVLELAIACRKNEIPFGISTNGFMTKQALSSILDEGLDFVNMDIKSFQPEFLRDIIGINGALAEKAKNIFLRNLKSFINDDHIKMVEVSTPIVHNLNNFEVIDIAKEIARIDDIIPYHIQRMVPEYQYKGPDVQVGIIQETEEYYQKTLEILEYVYFGAFPNSQHVHTKCKNCGEILIKRADFGGCQANMLFNKLKKNKCPNCNTSINVFF